MSDTPEIPYDKFHPHYFYRETYKKWVRYGNQWFTPEEWEIYYHKHSISPKVEWYHDILKVMKDAESAILRDPSPERLRRYFAMVERILRYFNGLRMQNERAYGQGTP